VRLQPPLRPVPAPLLALLLFALAPVSARAGEAAEPAADGAAVYAARCEACHGADGRGTPGRAMFQMAMPDFTDCAFATREGDADWLAVAHAGGPARAFSELMPAFGAVLDEAELRAALAHLRSFCRDPRWPRGELNLPRPLVTEKAFPEDEALVTSFANTNRDGAVETELVFEKRIGPRAQLELAVPIAAAEEPAPSSHWNAGVGDVGVAAKFAFFHDLDRGSIASLGGEVRLPSGDESRGLGTGSVVFEPFLAAGQILPLGAFLQLQALGEIPVDSALADEAQLRMALGRSFALGRFGRWLSPMVEVVGTWAFEDRVDEQWDLVPQVQVALSRRQHVRLDVGVRIPLTDSSVRATRVGAYLLWDFVDGGLFEGW
jgi:mono/diheme cytochrome c family protein